MSDFDVYDHPDNLPPNHLLDELESIKGVLDSNDEEAAVGDIPLLDDMVIGNLNANTKLLNLNQIFEEDIDAETDIDDAPANKRVRPDYSREVLIQELVDEFIPQIEAALHERLRGLDDTTLQRLKERE